MSRLFAIDDATGFEGRCTETQQFTRPLSEVYQALHRMAEWPQHLPHVKSIEVTHDDGQYQEFWMTVASENEMTLKVRSVRNCRPETIEFFQPQPPPYLAHHGGVWRFTSTGEDSCEVSVTHVWNLNERAAEFFPAEDPATTAAQVEKLLAGHSRLALDRWASVLDGGQ